MRIYLDRHWALETGLMYTQLSSEMWNNSNGSRFKQEQTLHYVGVPLKLNRTLWENKWIDLYASAGGAVEKNVSAKIKTAYSSSDNAVNKNSVDLDIDRLQWSVSGGVGAQFHLTDKLGAYVEPGINYYFDDGVDIQTIRKEHPLNFNLKLGLRLNLGR
ncbi:MAG: PorT family protein [Phocaeicola sp.]|nr:PorT family protein [Phocaeicola sp.]